MAIMHAEAQGDQPDQKRVATRRLSDPVPAATTKPKTHHKAPKRKKATR